MNEWFNLLQVIKILNKELGKEKFTYKKLETRIKKSDLKAINVAFPDIKNPIWKIKREWIEEFKEKYLREHLIKTFQPNDEEREEAILYPLSKKLGRQITFKELRERLPGFSELQKKVLILRYGLEDNSFKSFEKVGKIMGVSKQRIIEIEESILKILE